jgi:hypothetical protein
VSSQNTTRSKDISDLRHLSKFLDAQFRLPGGLRIGWDGIIGFIPGVGDIVTSSMSFYILLRAAMLGCPPSVIIRMGINIVIDNLLDLIPILGNVFDFFWKSNMRNVKIVEKFITNPQATSKASVVFVILALIIAFLMMLLSLLVVIFMVVKIFEYLQPVLQGGW